jgi:hypothetical protein
MISVNAKKKSRKQHPRVKDDVLQQLQSNVFECLQSLVPVEHQSLLQQQFKVKPTNTTEDDSITVVCMAMCCTCWTIQRSIAEKGETFKSASGCTKRQEEAPFIGIIHYGA